MSVSGNWWEIVDIQKQTILRSLHTTNNWQVIISWARGKLHILQQGFMLITFKLFAYYCSGTNTTTERGNKLPPRCLVGENVFNNTNQNSMSTNNNCARQLLGHTPDRQTDGPTITQLRQNTTSPGAVNGDATRRQWENIYLVKVSTTRSTTMQLPHMQYLSPCLFHRASGKCLPTSTSFLRLHSCKTNNH